MADRIDARPDHVAVAVSDPAATHPRWGERLGGGTVNIFGNRDFVGRQYRYANGAKVELVAPNPFAGGDSFLARFLDRFGTRIHHVTLKVPDLLEAVDIVRAAGLDVVDVDTEHHGWQEGFLRPTQVGGLIVQLAASPWSDDEWAQHTGVAPTAPDASAAELLGPRLRHPDLEAAAELWSLLGADVERHGDAVRCRWASGPLTVVIDRGEPAGPVALRMGGTPPLPHEEGVGPTVEV